MLKKWIFALILFCSIGLLGCGKQSSTDIDTTQLTESLEQPAAKAEAQTEPEPEPEMEPEPAVINIIDPRSNEIIHSLSPNDFGYDTDIIAYVAKIEQFAKELARGTAGKSGYDQRMILDKLDEQGQVIKGSPLILLRESILVERIMAASAEGGNVELPIEVMESGYDPEDVPIWKTLQSQRTRPTSSQQTRTGIKISNFPRKLSIMLLLGAGTNSPSTPSSDHVMKRAATSQPRKSSTKNLSWE